LRVIDYKLGYSDTVTLYGEVLNKDGSTHKTRTREIIPLDYTIIALPADTQEKEQTHA
jgi:hypothetical protein